MMIKKICPRCEKLTVCIEYDTHNNVVDDHLTIETECLCTECHCVFSEIMHYSLHYEDTEVHWDHEEDE